MQDIQLPEAAVPDHNEPAWLMFRAPLSSKDLSGKHAYVPPPQQFLQGPWHVTHTTLPMWKTKRNVVITYTPLDHPAGGIDDLITYKPLSSDQQKSIHGCDTPDTKSPACYTWRGRGWLKLITSHWEILGYGEEDDGWLVTFFNKSLFTPAGIDICARRKGGLSQKVLERVKGAIADSEEEDVKRLVDSMFEVKQDW